MFSRVALLVTATRTRASASRGDTSTEAASEFLRKVDAELLVTGHIPADEGFTVPNPRQITLDCSGSPGAYVLFPTDRPLTHAELVAAIGVV